MSDLQSAAAKSAASGAGIGATLPLDPVTMGVGLVAALVALMHTAPPEGEARTPWRVFALVAGSAFLSGVFVPVAVAGGLQYAPWLAGVADRHLQLAAAALIGAAPHLAPALWRAWRASRGGTP